MNITNDEDRRLKRLTAREREVMHHVCEGKHNKEIAFALGISPRTVEAYKARVKDKLVRALQDECEQIGHDWMESIDGDLDTVCNKCGTLKGAALDALRKKE